MSEPKFTPGPWTVDPTPETLRGGDWQGRVMAARERIIICGCPVNENRNSECNIHWEPNASLIAAAPEMYAMLEHISQWIESHDEWWMDRPDRGGFDNDKIDILLRKARGEA